MPISKIVTASVLFAAALSAQSLTGQWDCTVTVNGAEIPFRMEFSAGGAARGGQLLQWRRARALHRRTTQEGLLVERLLGETTSATAR